MSIDHGSRTETLSADAPTGADAPVRQVRLGRPPLDPSNAPGVYSPVWHVRAPQHLDVAARERAGFEGRDLSALVRDAVRDYLRGAAGPTA